MSKSQPQHILVTHVYSSANNGDAALVSVLLGSLHQQFPGATLRILTLESATPAPFEGVAQQPSYMFYALNSFRPPLLRLAYTFWMFIITIAWALWLRWTGKRLPLPARLRQVSEQYARADLIVPVGGGYLRSRGGLANRLNVPLLLHPLLIGYILKKPTVLYAQSVGPFSYRYELRMVAWVIRRMTLVMLREDVSQKLLASAGVRANVIRTVDAGFLLQSQAENVPNIRQRYSLAADRPLLGVTVRSWLSAQAQARYEVAVAAALDDAIIKHGLQVLFIPQVTAGKGDDDRLCSQRVFGHMQQTQAARVVTEPLDCHAIKAVYDELDLLLGTRFHSVIFSLTSYVPVVAIEYEHKTSGIMHDLGLDDWVIKIEDTTEQRLTDLLDRLVRRQAAYKRRLHRCLPPYVHRATAAAEALAGAYYKAPSKPADKNETVLTNHHIVEAED